MSGRTRSKSLSRPDESVEIDLGRMDVVTLGDLTIGRTVAQPGWRWSTHIRPMVGGDWCQSRHVGVVVSGRQLRDRHSGRQGRDPVGTQAKRAAPRPGVIGRCDDESRVRT